MPGTLPGNVPVKPIRIVLVINQTYSPAAEHRELLALGTWLEARANPATRITVINTPGINATLALPPYRLGTTRPRHHEQGLAAALRAAFRAGHGRPLLVTLSPNPTLGLQTLTTLRVRTRVGAPLPTYLGLHPGKTAIAWIDPSRTRTLAATTSRAVIVVSNLRARG